MNTSKAASLSARNKTESRRDEILNLAEQAILNKGVSATTIEELIFEIGISKNGFYYHFKDKNQLIAAILERNLVVDELWFAELFKRADQVSSDPLHSFLTFLDLFAEEMKNLPDLHPGCLTTACCYQEKLLDSMSRESAAKILILWRNTTHERLKKVAREHPPKTNIDLEALADMMPALIDGAIIFSRVVKDNNVLTRQVQLYKQFVENIFLDRLIDLYDSKGPNSDG